MPRSKVTKLEPRESDWLSEVQHYTSLGMTQLKAGDAQAALGTFGWVEAKLYAIGFQAIADAGKARIAHQKAQLAALNKRNRR